jgi:hypothetical protein
MRISSTRLSAHALKVTGVSFWIDRARGFKARALAVEQFRGLASRADRCSAHRSVVHGSQEAKLRVLLCLAPKAQVARMVVGRARTVWLARARNADTWMGSRPWRRARMFTALDDQNANGE